MIDALIIDMIGWLHMTGMAPPRANDTWKRSDTYAGTLARQLVTLPINRQLHSLRRRRRHNRMTAPGHQPP